MAFLKTILPLTFASRDEEDVSVPGGGVSVVWMGLCCQKKRAVGKKGVKKGLGFFFLSTVNFCGLDSTSGESCFLRRHHAAVLQPLRPL